MFYFVINVFFFFQAEEGVCFALVETRLLNPSFRDEFGVLEGGCDCVYVHEGVSE